MSLNTRRRLAAGLAAFDVVVVVVWARVWLLDGPGRLTPFDVGGSLFWVPPASFALLSKLGFWLLSQHGLEQRGRPPLVFLSWMSFLVLVPLSFYALLGMSFILYACSGGMD